MFLKVAHYLSLFFKQSLTAGVLLLGCVKESNQFELVISLPNGLTGFVQATRISDAYNEMLNEQVATDAHLEVRQGACVLRSCLVGSASTTKQQVSSVQGIFLPPLFPALS